MPPRIAILQQFVKLRHRSVSLAPVAATAHFNQQWDRQCDSAFHFLPDQARGLLQFLLGNIENQFVMNL